MFSGAIRGDVNIIPGQKLQTLVLAANYTLKPEDSGKLIIADAADIVVTLPATSEGLNYRFAVKTLSTTTGLSISPQAVDQIAGAGLTSVDDKDLVNTAATDAEGDYVELVADGTDGWYITTIIGTWAKQA